MSRCTRPRDIAARRAAVTRRMYAWEGKWVPKEPTAPMVELQRLAARIWRENTRRRDRCPAVVAGRGLMQAGRLVSYCLGRCRIVLARNQRTRHVLIHEMAHALGPETHGSRFQNRYADLLIRYADKIRRSADKIRR